MLELKTAHTSKLHSLDSNASFSTETSKKDVSFTSNSSSRRFRSSMNSIVFETKGKQTTRAFTAASVVSAPRPLAGQKNRSSGNFGINFTSSTLRWEVYDASGFNSNIRFNVMKDIRFGSDSVMFRGLGDYFYTNRPSVNKFNLFGENDLYIARPSGATGNFTVVVTAVVD